MFEQYNEDASADLDAAQTIAELQFELKNTIACSRELKKENVDLKKQLESTHAFSEANLKRHAGWKETWKKEREIVANREKQLEKEEATWASKLEERKSQLNEIEKKKVLAEDAFSCDILKVAEADHTEKVEKLTNEVSNE